MLLFAWQDQVRGYGILRSKQASKQARQAQAGKRGAEEEVCRQDLQVRRTVDVLTGGASHRIALRNCKSDTPIPLRSDPVPEEEEEEEEEEGKLRPSENDLGCPPSSCALLARLRPRKPRGLWTCCTMRLDL